MLLGLFINITFYKVLSKTLAIHTMYAVGVEPTIIFSQNTALTI